MARRRIRVKDEEAITEPVVSELTADQVAAYLRQSTTRQTIENLESKELQLTGAQRYAISQGLDANKIVIQWEGEGKKGVSGTKRIDQREKLSEIMQGIEEDKVKVVWAYSVSRLFRDKYGVQVGTFIETCAKHGVKVVIGQMMFDFSNSVYVTMFQMMASQAAQENELRAKLMSEGRSNKARRGEYDGRPIVVGYIVDRNPESPTYFKYIPYEPHAEVVRWLYKRYRELGGRFNLLAREVALMPVLFPDFDKDVDKKSVHRLMLKKVPGGYHITKKSLFNLMTSVEYAGYWQYDNGLLRTDEQGKPIVNHEPIVDQSDWRFAYERMSFTNLDGSENKHRANARTWVPSVSKGKNNEPKTLLHGLLTSPIGTVQYSKEYTRDSARSIVDWGTKQELPQEVQAKIRANWNIPEGTYCITEQRQGNPDRSITLVVNVDAVDTMFMFRLQDRYLETGQKPYDRIIEELTRVRANNEKALFSVPRQIEGYQKAIAAKQAILGALGGEADIETAKCFNKEIKEARAHIQELTDMKNAAKAEEGKLMELAEKIDQVLMGIYEDKNMIRRFIQLVTGSIELNEYSNHFATLTVKWSKPFQQVDVGYIYLPGGVREPWSDQDIADLKALYPHASRIEIMQRFPTRSWRGIQQYAYGLGIARKVRDIDNNREISDRSVSLLDYEVMQKFGIDSLKDYQMVNSWDTNVDNVLSTSRGEVTYGNRKYNWFISLDTCTAASCARFAD